MVPPLNTAGSGDEGRMVIGGAGGGELPGYRRGEIAAVDPPI